MGDTAAQLSGVLPASCHVLLFSATGVHVSGVSGSGSHFLRPFATTDAAQAITDAAFCTRLHVALTVATQATVALSSNIATALAVVDACTAIAAAPSLTLRADAATDAAADMEAEPRCMHAVSGSRNAGRRRNRGRRLPDARGRRGNGCGDGNGGAALSNAISSRRCGRNRLDDRRSAANAHRRGGGGRRDGNNGGGANNSAVQAVVVAAVGASPVAAAIRH